MAGEAGVSGIPVPGGENVKVEFEDGIAWVKLNRPHKRNAMSVALAAEMNQVLDALELDDRCGVLVLTGEGEAFSAGMDLRDFFRATDKKSDLERHRAYRETRNWQWRKLMFYGKPTIAMVNGWCFGGAFTPMIWRSRPRRRCSACPRSTGASSPAASCRRPCRPWSTTARRSTTS